jgi:hypothetical protein
MGWGRISGRSNGWVLVVGRLRGGGWWGGLGYGCHDLGSLLAWSLETQRWDTTVVLVFFVFVEVMVLLISIRFLL